MRVVNPPASQPTDPIHAPTTPPTDRRPNRRQQDKKRRRLQKNRESARECRRRQRAHADELATRVQSLQVGAWVGMCGYAFTGGMD